MYKFLLGHVCDSIYVRSRNVNNRESQGVDSNFHMNRLRMLVVIILGGVAMLCVVGITILRLMRLEVEPTLTAGLCTSLGALTGILVHPPLPEEHRRD